MNSFFSSQLSVSHSGSSFGHAVSLAFSGMMPRRFWLAKIVSRNFFQPGWKKLRETIFANQKRLGIMPENAKLTAWPKELPEWDTLSWDEKKLFIKQANVYAAYLAYTDQEI